MSSELLGGSADKPVSPMTDLKTGVLKAYLETAALEQTLSLLNKVEDSNIANRYGKGSQVITYRGLGNCQMKYRGL